MKLLADECVEAKIVESLRSKGIQITYVSDVMPGAADDEVLKLANQNEAILLTADKDFGEIVFRQGRAMYGVILLRLHGLSSQTKSVIVFDIISKYTDILVGKFTVVTQTSVRITEPLGKKGKRKTRV